MILICAFVGFNKKTNNKKYTCPVYMSRSEAALSRSKPASPKTSPDSCSARSHSK